MNIYKTTAMLGMSLALFFCAPLFAAIKPRFEAGVSFGGGTSPVVNPKVIASFHAAAASGRVDWSSEEDGWSNYTNYHFYGGVFLFEKGAPERFLHEIVLDVYSGKSKHTLKSDDFVLLMGKSHHLNDVKLEYKNEGAGILYHLYSPSYYGFRVYGGAGFYSEQQKIKVLTSDGDTSKGNSNQFMLRPSGGFAFLPGFENSKIAGKIALELFAELRPNKKIESYGSDFKALHESYVDGWNSGKTGSSYGLNLSLALIF